jgi:hypothetical protein
MQLNYRGGTKTETYLRSVPGERCCWGLACSSGVFTVHAYYSSYVIKLQRRTKRKRKRGKENRGTKTRGEKRE